ncbi:integrase/recombinase XerD [Bradyrhizobium sp. LA6.10]|uniref:tyrosine-type recombinase/integrase n=1 Tax=Bradyrhizobium sp. LA6.10 TaxID=3156318 RepID=UPI0033997820
MLSNEVARYVALNRSLGLKFNNEDQILRSFATYAEVHGDQHTRTDRIFDLCRSASSPTRARSFYAAIRRLCVFLHAENPQHEIPPAGAFGRGRCPRPAPHLLDPHQVRALMMAALELPPKGSISPHSYHHLFGLLATTGLRISEALALKRGDLIDDGLIVRRGKFGKSRLLPIHPTTRLALNRYLAKRDRLNAGGDDLFVVTTGRAPQTSTVYQVFRRLAHQLGIRELSRTPGPRLHDLRHTFAVRSLEACAHDRGAVSTLMLALSTYLGHSEVAHTYWYLEATPVLLRSVAEASEQLFHGRVA